MNGSIRLFYAVTQNSVYQVTDVKDERGWPTVRKVAARSGDKMPLGSTLKEGTLVGISRFGIILYNHIDRKDPELVNIVLWGGKTSPLVGLFLKKPKALKCFNSNNPEMCDARWQRETKKVINAIGKDHPVFVVSKSASPIVL